MIGGLIASTGCHQTGWETCFPQVHVENVRRAADRVFARAVMFKPTEAARASTEARFAPLFLTECCPSEPPSGGATGNCPALIGAVTWSRRTAVIAGVPHEQWTYCWVARPGQDAAGEADPAADAGIVGTLRITLDAGGMPAIWEVRTGVESLVGLYVGRRLEDDLCKLYGPVSPTMRYAVERAAGVGSGAAEHRCLAAVVVRVLDDAPEPMGPIVYLDAAGRVTSVACRCMPAQVDEIAASGAYDLRAGQADGLLPADPDWLESALRLPANW